MMKAILILASLFATWMMWPEISERFAQRWDDLPSLPTLGSDVDSTSEVTDPDIIYHSAHQWDPATAPMGTEDPAPPALVHPGQGDGGCNRILPNSGRCDTLQYHSGPLHIPTNGIAGKDLL